LQGELVELEYKLYTRNDESYVNNSIKDIIKLNEIVPKALDVLINRITCNMSSKVTIQYNFSSPLL